ncbi:hypothetical protein [Streptomyces sp. NPDC001889]
MYEHIQYVTMAADLSVAADGFSIGGRLLGSVGYGGLATALTAGMVAGIKEPKGKEGKKVGTQRRKLSSSEASVMGLIAGTFYIAAGSIWTVGPEVSEAFASVFTSGAFGQTGMGGVALIMSVILYFRAPAPGKAAIMSIILAGVCASAGGIWGLPEYALLLLAGKLGLL